MKKLISFLLLFLICSQAWATDVTFQEGVSGYSGTSDDELYEALPNTVLHSSWPDELWAGRYSASYEDFRSLLKFDISSLPAGVTITSATLRLYCSLESDTTDRTISIHRALTAWSNGNCTWNRSNNSGAIDWNAAGGLSGTDYAAVATTTASYTGTGIDLDFNVLADVQAWYGGATNNGWFIIGDEIWNYATKQFASEHVATTANRPELLITYTSSNSTNFFQVL